ncbi:DUF1385 domain-containing protein [Sporohalobacter salinus]|uniref:DUF1385 domain-containing protein n=1 Tax=Sporohalobacter salinus TaxID=1494606 RepID=UPI001960A1BC|nr:DUF1385 domain-containing protein [Sporohalobacter salinus]MBM7624486.1 uncharacterized protein YqhQ [Sporohalobacter salinus]
MKIGGRAYRNGVRLFGQKYSVKAYYEDNKLKYEVGENVLANNKLFLSAKKVPILRGMVSIIFSLFYFLKESFRSPKKFWPIILLIIFDIGLEIYFKLMPNSSFSVSISPVFTKVPLYLVGLTAIIMLLRMTVFKELFKFHGAEHKAVNYYQSNNKQNISSHSRLARRCGTNLVVFYLLIILALEAMGLIFNVYLEALIAIGIAYELILILPKSLLSLPYLVQKITTIEPDAKHIKAAETALDILVSMEKQDECQIIA